MAEFAQYRHITSRLKKRFTLRKPNYREASEAFKKLATELGSFPDYAGYCLLTAAQCEHNIVLGFKEQLSSGPLTGSSASTFTYNSSSGSISSSAAAAAASKTSINLSKGNTSATSLHSSENAVGYERLVYVATEAEFNTMLEAARVFRRSKQTDQAIVAYAQAIKICPAKMSTVVYNEFASMYEDLKRFHEAGEIYLEAGLYRQAANSLLAGLYFEDAYQCYLELFRQCRDHQLSLTSSLMPDTAASSASRMQQQQQHSHLAGANNKLNPETDQLSRCGLFANDHLTIDDYITIFLLRLYLYDPIKYDYTLPIIPVPAGVVKTALQFPTQANSCNEEDEVQTREELTSSNGVAGVVGVNDFSPRRRSSIVNAALMDEFSIETMMMPYIDWTTRGPKRSLERLIELNMLLETLLLSYRHELKRTIDAVDNEFANRPDDELNDEVEVDEKITSVGSLGGGGGGGDHLSVHSRPETSHDGSSLFLPEEEEDDVRSLISETDLVDFSATLEDMAHRLVLRDCTEQQQHGAGDDRAEGDDDKLNEQLPSLDQMTKTKLLNQSKRVLAGGECFLLNQEDRLRHQVAVKLHPLLNGHQNTILYFIIKDKQ